MVPGFRIPSVVGDREGHGGDVHLSLMICSDHRASLVSSEGGRVGTSATPQAEYMSVIGRRNAAS